jgi:hypothetical protein
MFRQDTHPTGREPVRSRWLGRNRLIAIGAAAAVAGAGVAAIVVNVVSPVTNCAAAPSKCGFPDGTNSGVPAGMTLRAVPGQVSSGPGWSSSASGSVVVTGNGAVLSGLYIPGLVQVKANNVTIKDVKIVASGQSGFGISLRTTSNTTIEDSSISGKDATTGRLAAGIKDIYSDSSGTSIVGNNIWYTTTGVQIDEGLIQDNYIHDTGYLAGDHLNGITSNGGTKSMTIQGNTIFTDRSQTDAISLFQDFGTQANRVITNNLLAGGGYCIYGGNRNGSPPATGIQITNNRFSTIYYPKCGYYGPVAYFTLGGGNTWAGNVWDDTGQTVPAP